MNTIDKVIYTARTHTTGGRDGTSRGDDGRPQLQLSSPGTRGIGTNAEENTVLPELLEQLRPTLIADDTDARLLDDLIRHLATKGPPLPVPGLICDARRLDRMEDLIDRACEERDIELPSRALRVLVRWFSVQRESALHRAYERLVAILDSFPDHVTMHGFDGGVIFANKAAREGMPPAMTQETIARARAGATARSEMLSPSLDGPRWREQIVRPLRYREDEITDVVVASRDIHSRKVAETENLQLHEELRRAEERFTIALAHTNVSVYELALDGCLTWIYDTRVGAPPSDELLGTRLQDIVDPLTAVRVIEIRRRVIEEGVSCTFEVDLSNTGQRRRHVIHYEPSRKGDEIVGIIGASIDVTQEREVQSSLSEALSIQECMMGVLGHDLRNPLSAVRGTAGVLLLQGNLDERMRERLHIIDRASRRMAELIDTLLDSTRMRFHGLNLTEFDLAHVARAGVDEALAADPTRRIELEAASVVGRWDEPRVAEMLANLVSNALAHGDGSEPIVVRVTGDDKRALLEVVNAGPPIVEADRLFEAFERGSPSKGLGLGLFIVRQIVVAHGGTVDAESSAGRTRFAVGLPRWTAV